MCSTSVECPPCKAKSNGVVPSSLGSSKALTPPGRHKRKWKSLGRPHLTARCRRDSLWRDTEEKGKHVVSSSIHKLCFVHFINELIHWVWQKHRGWKESKVSHLDLMLYKRWEALEFSGGQGARGHWSYDTHGWYRLFPSTMLHPVATQDAGTSREETSSQERSSFGNTLTNF